MPYGTMLNIGPAFMPDFVTGAQFYAILAWPTLDEFSDFQRVSEELAAEVIRLSNAGDPDSVQSAMNRWPNVNWPSLTARAQKRKHAIGYLNQRLKQRMAAARIGIGKAHEQIFGIPARLPQSMTAMSLNQLCRLIATDVYINDPENIENLVWRKSLPIIHLAMATQLMLSERHKGNERVVLRCDLQDRAFYRDIVNFAEDLENLVHNHPDFNITRDSLTRVRWLE